MWPLCEVYTVRNEYVCLSVCLHASISRKLHVRTLSIFWMLTVTMARCSPSGVAIRYALPVLWMASCFSHSWRENSSVNYCIDSHQSLLNDKDQQLNMRSMGLHVDKTIHVSSTIWWLWNCINVGLEWATSCGWGNMASNDGERIERTTERCHFWSM